MHHYMPFIIDNSKKQPLYRKSAKEKKLLQIIIPKVLLLHGHFIS